ncbi:MAG: ribonuclease P protein component [Bacteroidetes bacterium]|nr:ribonuclease P protein component [Bacteroidota bacterium]MBL0052345.1 ribonuclease P protein component [Bacteroidota bacterium]
MEIKNTTTPQHKHNFKFGKEEKLCSRKIFELLVTKGENFFIHPFKVIYLKHELPIDGAPLQVAFVVPKRNFKKAHDRNFIKRHMREAYRHNKHKLFDQCVNQKQKMALLLIYAPKNLTNFYEVSQKIVLVLHRLIKVNGKHH